MAFVSPTLSLKGGQAAIPVRMIDEVGLPAPGGAGRRSPNPDPGAPRANQGTPSARRGEGRATRDTREAPRRDLPVLRQVWAPRAVGAHPAAGIGAPRRACARPGSPPRAPPGDAGGKEARDSKASSRPRGPSGGDDALGHCSHRSRGTGSPGPDGGAPAARRGESSGSGPRSRPRGRPHHGASPPGWHRRPGAGTFPMKLGLRQAACFASRIW